VRFPATNAVLTCATFDSPVARSANARTFLVATTFVLRAASRDEVKLVVAAACRTTSREARSRARSRILRPSPGSVTSPQSAATRPRSTSLGSAPSALAGGLRRGRAYDDHELAAAPNKLLGDTAAEPARRPRQEDARAGQHVVALSSGAVASGALRLTAKRKKSWSIATWSANPTTNTRRRVPELPQRKNASTSVPPIAESAWSTTY
jgi:hypothetical protein